MIDRTDQLASTFHALEIAKLLPTSGEIGSRVEELSKMDPAASSAERSEEAIRRATLRMTGVGVVAALLAAVPGVGTGVALASGLTIDTALVLRNLAGMQLTVAALYGHDLDDPERKTEFLIVSGLATGGLMVASERTASLGSKVAVSQFNRHISGQMLAAINRRLGVTVLTKFGTKRGAIAIGRLIPFGVGAAVGGGMNYWAGRAFGRHLLDFYGRHRPEDSDLVIVRPDPD